jgi:hypothetical protein
MFGVLMWRRLVISFIASLRLLTRHGA